MGVRKMHVSIKDHPIELNPQYSFAWPFGVLIYPLLNPMPALLFVTFSNIVDFMLDHFGGFFFSL